MYNSAQQSSIFGVLNVYSLFVYILKMREEKDTGMSRAKQKREEDAWEKQKNKK